MLTKTCTRCHVEQPLHSYHADCYAKDRRKAVCKACSTKGTRFSADTARERGLIAARLGFYPTGGCDACRLVLVCLSQPTNVPVPCELSDELARVGEAEPDEDYAGEYA